MAETKKEHYSKYRHPEYAANVDKWKFAQAVYDGSAYDIANLNDFVPKKEQRESDKAYEERKKLLDPVLHYATGIDSLVGVMTDSEKRADYSWYEEDKAEGLGDPEEPGTIAHRLTRDADGEGTNWEFIPNQGAIKLSMYQKLWGLVDGRPKNEAGDSIGDARVKLIDPQHVVNWYEENGRLAWVLVSEMRDIRTSYLDDPKFQQCYVEYTLSGWRRFYLDKDGNEVQIGEPGTYEFYRTKDKTDGDRILPIWPTEISLPRNPGYLWAKKSNAIQNFESRLDFAHMTITFAMLQVAVTGENLKKFKEQFKDGLNILNIAPDASRDHKFLEQDSSFFESSEKRLAKKVEDFYKNMFKDYGDAARERTAQEVRLESKSGIEAFLALLVGSQDEFDNQALWRISQIYFPKTPDVWGDAHVKRTADFSPQDVDKILNNLKNRYIGSRPIPLPANALANVIKRILSEDNIDLGDTPDDEIETIAQSIIDQFSREGDLSGAFGVGG